MDSPLLSIEFPDLARELKELLSKEGATDLVAQVPSLRLVDRCRCTDDFCAMMYTAPRPDGAWGPGHENIALSPKQGDLILDVVDREIVALEVLFREDIRNRLLQLLP